MKSRITLTNSQQETRRFTRRLWLLGFGIIALMAVLMMRLTYLQIVQHNRYTTLAEKNQLAIEFITPSRGLIYDRNGELLAENVPVASLELIPDKIDDIDDTVAKLRKIIDIDDDERDEFNKLLDQRRSFDSIPLKVKLTETEEAAFYVNQYQFPGVTVQAHLIRHYLFGEALSPVLGYVARINQQELKQVDPSNYSSTDYIGKVGIEKYYETILHGTAGNQQVEIDASGRAVRTLKQVPPIAGQNIYLTIDSKLQQFAMNALGDKRGAVVAIQPKTGQLLALVSNPSYNSNVFVKGISSKDFKTLRESPYQPLYNRALRGQYPPASTIKPYIALQGLITGHIKPEDKIFDPGWFQLPNSTHLYRDFKKSGHGWVNVIDAIKESCDTFFYSLAHRMGITELNTILTKFGFGNKTGIDMGEELGGLVPSPAWKKTHRGTAWYPGDTVITGIGQGFTAVTPLQLANAIATLAMEGNGHKPYLLLKSKPVGENFIESPPQTTTPVDIPPKAWQTVIAGMRAVIEDPAGTGHVRFGLKPTYSVAAKTGTAQLFSIRQDEKAASQEGLPERLRDHSLFIAFAPVEDPEIALAVVVENSKLAPTIARKILDFYILNKDDGNKSIPPQQKP